MEEMKMVKEEDAMERFMKNRAFLFVAESTYMNPSKEELVLGETVLNSGKEPYVAQDGSSLGWTTWYSGKKGFDPLSKILDRVENPVEAELSRDGWVFHTNSDNSNNINNTLERFKEIGYKAIISEDAFDIYGTKLEGAVGIYKKKKEEVPRE